MHTVSFKKNSHLVVLCGVCYDIEKINTMDHVQCFTSQLQQTHFSQPLPKKDMHSEVMHLRQLCAHLYNQKVKVKTNKQDLHKIAVRGLLVDIKE